MPFCETDAGRLYYRLDGADDTPVVVLHHSLGLDHGMWDAQAADLAPHFRVLRFDARGHGASPAPAGSTVTYQLVVTNAGPSIATGAAITDAVPPQLTGVSWSCVAAGTSSCGSASGTGDVNLSATVGVGRSWSRRSSSAS